MTMFDVYPLNDISITRAEGSYVWDSEGTQYLDMYGGHAVISIGHTNPVYVDAICDQISKIGFYSNSVVIEQQQDLADKLGRLMGRSDYQLFLCNSGAEANENAIKLASFYNGRKKVVAFRGAFHGRTSMAVSVTDNQSIVAPVNQTDNVVFLPYNDIDALKEYFGNHGSEVSSVIVEGIQGVGGIKLASEQFLKAIRSLCDKHEALMIADSVQCGCGRSGKYFSHDWAGVDADIYSMAKGLGNGFPIGAIAIAPHIPSRHGMLGTTFGGNHLACRAAIAVVDVIKHERLMENAAHVGKYLMDELSKLESLSEVRGRGLMIGIELPYDSTDIRNRLLFEERIFVGASGKNVIRLLPALNITKEHADQFLTAFKKLLTTEG